MTEISILEILLVSFLLLAPIIAGYLGLRVLKLNKRVVSIQKDRDKALENWYRLLRGKPMLSEIEKKMILNALKMPEHKELIKKIKESLD